MQLQQSQSSLQELRQEQTMTYQQIQALELLAAPVMDLQTIIRAEIERLRRGVSALLSLLHADHALPDLGVVVKGVVRGNDDHLRVLLASLHRLSLEESFREGNR